MLLSKKPSRSGLSGPKHSLARSSGRNCVPKRLRFHPHARVARGAPHIARLPIKYKATLTRWLFAFQEFENGHNTDPV